ncbi:MAG: phosphonate C-P lyase system protein PhnH [Rhizobiales bacterium]|nr:phosphonate C-P lyase system protein PhnH [Hyphomicrobiales bacterium]
MPTHTAAALPGLADPVRDSQRIFRAVMEALSRPGMPRPLTELPAPPEPLTAETGAVILTLADVDTPIWIDARLAGVPDVPAWLRFHTGAPIVAEPGAASFALIGHALAMPALTAFFPGTLDYPDRGATVLIALERLVAGSEFGVRLEGPGIETEARLAGAPLPATFWRQVAENNAGFPLGVDIILTAPGVVAGLPRSTRAIANGE